VHLLVEIVVRCCGHKSAPLVTILRQMHLVKVPVLFL